MGLELLEQNSHHLTNLSDRFGAFLQLQADSVRIKAKVGVVSANSGCDADGNLFNGPWMVDVNANNHSVLQAQRQVLNVVKANVGVLRKKTKKRVSLNVVNNFENTYRAAQFAINLVKYVIEVTVGSVNDLFKKIDLSKDGKQKILHRKLPSRP